MEGIARFLLLNIGTLRVMKNVLPGYKTFLYSTEHEI